MTGAVFATTILTALATSFVVLGGVAGYWGALVSARSDRRLRKFIEGQASEISDLVADDPDAD